MKGIILAGGRGTRLKACTKVTNKHLLPLYDRPMICCPIRTLVQAGITEIMIVVGKENAGDFLNFLGDGGSFGASFTYRLQPESGGIAQALGLCENFAGDESVAVILGDNYFEDDINIGDDVIGAKIFLKSVRDADRFGVAKFAKVCKAGEKSKIVKIVEKPTEPVSDMAVTGLYLYDNNVWEVIKKLKPSARGELEITDVNNWYLNKYIMDYKILNGYWHDCGTPDALAETTNFIKKHT